MKSPYGDDLAAVHHDGFSEFARSAAPAVVRLLRKRDLIPGLVVELGCGSGVLLQRLAEAGLRVVGVDRSLPMLAFARQALRNASLACVRLEDVRLPRCQAVIAMGEVLNYVDDPAPHPERLPDLIDRVAAALCPGGLFLFDVLVQSREAAVPHRTWHGDDDFAVLLDVSGSADGDVVTRQIITFRRRGTGWTKSSETHHLEVFDENELTGLLERRGFAVRTSGGYGRTSVLAGRRMVAAIRT